MQIPGGDPNGSRGDFARMIDGIKTQRALAAERGKSNKAKDSRPSREVEMFAAMKSGDLDVKFIPKNDREAKVIVKNLTKEPLSVKLPEAFAGVPVRQ